MKPFVVQGLDVQGEDGATAAPHRNAFGRALTVLRWMVEQDESVIGVRAVARALNMPPSSVSRSLAHLQAEGLVARDNASGGYTLGLELLRISRLAVAKFTLQDLAEPHLRRVAESCGEAVFLGVFDRSRLEMVRVAGIPSSHPLRYVVRLHQWTEIFRGASGLSILAFLPERERDLVLDRAEASASPEAPWLERTAMLETLQLVRRNGYSCTHGRRIPGAVGISSPIFDANDDVVGDVIVTLPESRFADHGEQRLGELVMVGASAITADLGGNWRRATDA